MDLKCTIPHPNDIPPPVWIFRYVFTPYTASKHVHSWLRLSSPITISSLIFCFKNCSILFNLAFYSTVILVTLVHRNDIDGSMLGISLFPTHISFATIECSVSAYCLSSLSEFLFMFCKTFLSGGDTFALSASPNCAIDQFIESFMNNDTLSFPRNYMPIPRNVWFTPIDTLISPNHSDIASIIPVFTCSSTWDTLLFSTYQAIVHYFTSMELFAMHL